MIQGSKRGIDNSFKNFEAYFKIEKQYYSCLLEAINFMQSIFGKYYISNQRLVFFYDSDLTIYNNFLARLDLIAENEKKWSDGQYLQIDKSFSHLDSLIKIGRASCRERVQISVVAVSLKKKQK